MPTGHPYYDQEQLSKSSSTSESSQYPTGLMNIGNTCYLNSAIQNIFLIEDFKQLCIQYASMSEIANNKDSVTYLLGKLFQDKQNNADIRIHSNTIEHMLQVLKDVTQKNMYANKEQKDPHEFLLDIIQCIHIENALPNSIGTSLVQDGIYEHFRLSYFQNNPENFCVPITLFTMKTKRYECEHSCIEYEGHSMYEVEIIQNGGTTIEDMIHSSISTKGMMKMILQNVPFVIKYQNTLQKYVLWSFQST